MKKVLLAILLFVNVIVFAQTGIGTTTPDPSAQLEVSSNDKGLLPPRMTQAERDAISSPAQGLIIFCTDCAFGEGELQIKLTSSWKNIAGGDVNDSTVITGSSNFGKVYIYSTNMVFGASYNDEMGIESVSGQNPVEILAITGQGTNNTPISAFENGNIGANSVNLAGSFTLTKVKEFTGNSSTPSLKTLLENNGDVFIPSTQPPGSYGQRIIILVPYNSSMTDVPIKMSDQLGLNPDFGIMYINSGGAFYIVGSTLNLLTLSSPQQGYSQWLVIFTVSPSSGGGKQIRIQPETDYSTP